MNDKGKGVAKKESIANGNNLGVEDKGSYPHQGRRGTKKQEQVLVLETQRVQHLDLYLILKYV